MIHVVLKGLYSVLPKGPIGDLLAASILLGASGVVLEAVGIPVFSPAWDWVNASVIDPVLNWISDQVTPW